MDCLAETTKLIVGLGNPGRRYAKTRHNVGWMVLAEARRRWGLADEGRKAFGGEVYDARRAAPDGASRRVMLFEPHMYMNRSGEAVAGLAAFYKADCRNLLIVMDDMDLPVGALRVRARGSAGGHKGLDDVLRLLGTQDVPRLRLGIGSPPPPMDAIDFVLGAFDDAELASIAPAVTRAADAVDDWIAWGIQAVMDKYNRKVEPD